ncbi:MAG TPA: Hsp20/alpha crystallin family protein [Chitinophagaceae bacterium]|jgi:Molecular chaperone (small heat shock protein)
MSNLVRRNENRGVDPWRDFLDFDFLGSRFPSGRAAMPAVNLSENEEGYNVEVVAPGYRKEDFKLKVNDDVLTISAESKNEKLEEKGTEYSRREYTCSSFTRSFQLPDNAKDDSIAAKYNDGILQIMIPKSKKEVKSSKEISIK